MNKGFTAQVDENANYLGEEDKGRASGTTGGGKVEPGPGRPVRWEKKRQKAGEIGEIRQQCLIFHSFEKGLIRESLEKGLGLGEQGTGGGGLDIPYPPPTITD